MEKFQKWKEKKAALMAEKKAAKDNVGGAKKVAQGSHGATGNDNNGKVAGGKNGMVTGGNNQGNYGVNQGPGYRQQNLHQKGTNLVSHQGDVDRSRTGGRRTGSLKPGYQGVTNGYNGNSTATGGTAERIQYR